MTLDFYPSLNSPYTSIIFDRTITLKDECGIKFNHKPVLPMIMRGVPAPRAKRNTSCSTRGEKVAFWVSPLDHSGRRSVHRCAKPIPFSLDDGTGKGRSVDELASECAFSGNAPLHQQRGMRKAVEMGGLDWTEAQKRMGGPAWKQWSRLSR